MNKTNLIARFIALVSIALFVGFRPAPAAADPFAYVTNFESDTVSVIDTATNTVVATVGVGDGPFGVAATPDGGFVYVTNIQSLNVSVIDTATNTVVATVPVELQPFSLAITPDGAFVYVANSQSGTVSVIDTASNTVVATVPVNTSPRGVAITPDGAFAYVANGGSASNNVSVIDTATNTVVTTVPVGMTPLGVAIVRIVALTTQVSIDIKPGSDPNSINLCSGGTVPVAIFSTDDFDATTVDPGTVRLADAQVKMVGNSSKELCHVEDVDSDGWDDLVCQIVTVELREILDGTSLEATLRATTFDGDDIEGKDAVNIVKDCE